MTLTFDGQLEIDQRRGVIYFHSRAGKTLLRVSGVTVPVADPAQPDNFIDVISSTHPMLKEKTKYAKNK